MSAKSTIVLITGANSGVGYATSKVIACAGPQFHVIMASRVAENGEKAVAELQASAGIKGSLSTVQLDVTDEASIRTAAAKIDHEFGRLDVLVNNAAAGSLGEMDIKKRFEQILAANVTGPAVVSEVFRPLLFKSKNPRSIFVSSGLGSMGRASDPSSPDYRLYANAGNYGMKTGTNESIFDPADAYRVSKAALNMVALQEYVKYDSMGLKVWALCPGLVRSNLRGKTEEARSAGGLAVDPETSGNTILDLIEGKRDFDVGKFVHKDGIYSW